MTNYLFPSAWPHFNKQRWTTADITLAKALIMMGYTTATKTMRTDGPPAITVIKINDDGSTPYVDEITMDSFQALKYGEASWRILPDRMPQPMTDFISRSDLRHIAEDLRHNSPKDNEAYFVACEVLDYVADRMPGPAPAEISTNGSYNCCGHCSSIDGVLDMEGGHNKFCGNCGWPIDCGD